MRHLQRRDAARRPLELATRLCQMRCAKCDPGSKRLPSSVHAAVETAGLGRESARGAWWHPPCLSLEMARTVRPRQRVSAIYVPSNLVDSDSPGVHFFSERLRWLGGQKHGRRGVSQQWGGRRERGNWRRRGRSRWHGERGSRCACGQRLGRSAQRRRWWRRKRRVPDGHSNRRQPVPARSGKMHLGSSTAPDLPHVGQLREDRLAAHDATGLLHLRGSRLRGVARGRLDLQ